MGYAILTMKKVISLSAFLTSNISHRYLIDVILDRYVDRQILTHVCIYLTVRHC